MPNNYYDRQSEMNPGELADGLAMEQEFDAISRGFAKLPEPHRDGRGFEGATRVGDPVDKTDAVNLGVLEKLNLPIYRKKITTEDWNTIVSSGIYDVVSASGANKAPGYPCGVLVVHVFNGVVTQLFYPDKNCAMIKRVCQSTSTQTWTEWDASYSSSMGAAGFRNKIINGDFSINQRGYVSGSATTPGAYTLDRWKVTGASGITYSIINGKTTITIPAGQTLIQIIEATNLPAGDYVMSWEGTAQGRISSGAYGTSGNVKFTANGGGNVSIEFSAGTLSYVQLERGDVDTQFEHRHYGYELQLCQRYCRELVGVIHISHAPVYGNAGWASSAHSIDMRTAPTIVSSSVTGQTNMSRGGVAATFSPSVNGTSGNIRVTVPYASSKGLSFSLGSSIGVPDAGNYAYANYAALLDAEL